MFEDVLNDMATQAGTSAKSALASAWWVILVFVVTWIYVKAVWAMFLHGKLQKLSQDGRLGIWWVAVFLAFQWLGVMYPLMPRASYDTAWWGLWACWAGGHWLLVRLAYPTSSEPVEEWLRGIEKKMSGTKERKE